MAVIALISALMLDQSRERPHGLDHLRALAILLVLVFHYRAYYGIPEALIPFGVNTVAAFGWSGVDLFFVLSGYLIGTKLFEDIDNHGQVRFKRFYLNRAFRILPAYLVALAIYFLFSEVQEGRGLQPLWKFLTFTQNLPQDLRANTFSHAWSLSAEEHFYLILPAILFLVFNNRWQRRGLYLLVALVALGVAFRYLNWVEFVEPQFGRRRLGVALKYLYYPTHVRLDGLVMGVAIAALFRYQPTIRDRVTRHGNMVLVAGLAVLFGAYQLFGGYIISPQFSTLATTLAGFPLISLGYGLAVVAALSPGSLLHRFQFKPMAWLATMSYAIYLVHKMTNHWINENLTDYVDLNDGAIFAACLTAAVAGGFVMHLIVEKPFLALRAQFS